MSPADKFSSLNVGDVVKGSPLFKGLTTEPVEVVARSKSQVGAVTLDVRFMGVKLATAAGKATDGKIVWWEAK